jgi:hypothetical protein
MRHRRGVRPAPEMRLGQMEPCPSSACRRLGNQGFDRRVIARWGKNAEPNPFIRPTRRYRMLKVLMSVAALALAASYAAAQNASPSDAAPQSAPNSGAGISGQPGNKSGPAVKSPSTTGSSMSTGAQSNEGRTMDASKIPGQPGNKSGPAVRAPAGQNPK